MLNKVILMGRITRELELKQTPSGVSALTFDVAVERDYADQNGNRETDFITCVAWRQTADFIYKFFDKGRMIALEGALRKRTYDDKNGNKRYVTEVYVDKAHFTGEKKADEGGQPSYRQPVSEHDRRLEESFKANAGKQNQEPAAQGLPDGLDDFDEVISDEGVPF